MIWSSCSARRSIMVSRHCSMSARRGSGMSASRGRASRSLVKYQARRVMRSMTPWNFSSVPMGIWTGTGTAPRRSLIISMVRQKLAPTRSILLTKQRRGTWYLLAWRHTVSDWGSTPATASKTTTPPSSTRRLRSTSTVKSTWPGVSMRLRWWPFQSQVVAAAVMVMPRSRSWGMKSITAVPSWTSPIL